MNDTDDITLTSHLGILLARYRNKDLDVKTIHNRAV